MTLERTAAAALVLLTLVAYVPVMTRGGFVWDDDDYVTENPTLRDVRGLARIWLEPGATPQYYPMTFTSLWLDHHLWGDRPAGYHVVNVALHAANAVLLWRVLALLSLPGAWLAAAIFAVHPVHVESVAWIAERKNVLSGLFYLLTVLLYLKAQDGGPRRRWMLAGSVGMFALALVSKASVMVLPAALVVLDIYPLRRLGGSREGLIGRAARAVWLEKIPFAILGLGGAIVTYYAQKVNLFITPLERYPLSARPAMVFYSLWFYLGKTAVPQALSPLYLARLLRP